MTTVTRSSILVPVITRQSSSGFTPSSIDGLTLFDARDLSLSDNDAIGTWAPKFGTTAGTITATTTARPTYKTGLLGTKPAARFDGTANILSSAITASDNHTIFLVTRPLTLTDTNERFMAVSAFGSIVNNATSGVYNNQKKAGFYSNSAFGQVDGGIDIKPWTCQMLTYAKSGNQIMYSDNLLLVTALAPDQPSADTALYIGAQAAGTAFINAEIALFGYCNRVLTATERNNLSSWINAYMSHTYVVFDGDSQLDESSYSIGSGAITSLGSGYSGSYFAIGGQTMDTVNGAKAAVTGVYSAYRKKNVCVMWAGTNDVVADTSAVDIIADISAYCTAVKAAGYKMIVVNILARDGLTAPHIAVRAAVNASLATNYATYADALVDVTADARLQDPTDTTYFDVDGVHLAAAGQAIVSALLVTAVQSV